MLQNLPYFWNRNSFFLPFSLLAFLFVVSNKFYINGSFILTIFMKVLLGIFYERTYLFTNDL